MDPLVLPGCECALDPRAASKDGTSPQTPVQVALSLIDVETGLAWVWGQ